MSNDKNVEAIELFLRGALTAPLPGALAQRRFAPRPLGPRWSPDLQPASARRAAALVLLHPSSQGPGLPLTVRHRHLPRHGGQISLPGGTIDPGESSEGAALREAEEEIGVPREAVRIVGALSTVWIAVSNFVVQPFVAVTDATPDFRAHPGEVAHLIDLPLGHLRDRARWRWRRESRDGATLEVPYLAIGDHAVWGATAMILGELASVFDRDFAPRPPGAGPDEPASPA